MDKYIGVDIGGTKCAVVLGDDNGCIIDKIPLITTDFNKTIYEIESAIESIILDNTLEKTNEIKAIGISCGGPLDSKAGIVKSPPNLPGWDDVHIVELFENKFGIKTYIENDADAGALAEWKVGAAKGCDNVIFLTFGTGLGAGLILNGKLYRGSLGMAGEIGHVRLYDELHEDPKKDVNYVKLQFQKGNSNKNLHIGYNKAGSYEGYCSGGGIAQYGLGTAKELADKARAGDKAALDIWNKVGHDFGRCLSILIDLLNPEVIVAGSIFTRCEDLIRPAMEKVLKEEVLEPSLNNCKIVGSKLGDNIGDIAALCVAMER